MKRFLKDNGLSLVFLALFIFSLGGQMITGLHQYNQQLEELGGGHVGFGQYLSSGHFLQATFENFESEFLQMALFVVLTIFLYQKGSSESKDPEGEDEVDREPSQMKTDAPWPVRRGGLFLAVYKHSLSTALTILFLVSLTLHFYGSMKDYNTEQSLKKLPVESVKEYIGNSRFWFESFQNWQSEFLSVLTIVVLTIFLRQKGSPQSKPVDEPDSTTGE